MRMELPDTSPVGEAVTTLTQRSGLFGRQSFSILEDRVVRRIEGLANSREDSFLFNEMRENPSRIQNCPWIAYLAAVVLLAFGALLLNLSAGSPPSADSAVFLAIGLMFAFMGLLALYGSYRKTYHVVAFTTVRGPLLIHYNNPSAEVSRPFVQLLQQKIADSRSVEKRLAKNLLRALRDAELLDEWHYREACK